MFFCYFMSFFFILFIHSSWFFPNDASAQNNWFRKKCLVIPLALQCQLKPIFSYIERCVVLIACYILSLPVRPIKFFLVSMELHTTKGPIIFCRYNWTSSNIIYHQFLEETVWFAFLDRMQSEFMELLSYNCLDFASSFLGLFF